MNRHRELSCYPKRGVPSESLSRGLEHEETRELCMIETSQLLDELATQLTKNVAETEALASLSRAARGFVPAPGRWSVDQCLDHLAMTADLYHPRIEAALASAPARSDAASARYRPGILGGRFARWVGPDSGVKMKAPKAFQSPPGEIVGDPAARVLECLQALAGFLDSARRVDLGKIRIPMPVPLLSLRLGDCFALQVGHQARHLAQARAVTEHPQFPS